MLRAWIAIVAATATGSVRRFKSLFHFSEFQNG